MARVGVAWTVVLSGCIATRFRCRCRLINLDRHDDRVQDFEYIGVAMIKRFDGGLDLRERKDCGRRARLAA